MDYSTFHNGDPLPMVGFGTWEIRGSAGRRAICQALEVGYRLLDTARMYDNEEIVGAALSDSGLNRRDVFLTTKLHAPCASYAKAREAIDSSLERLKTDYIDLLLIHEPYAQADEMYRAMQEARSDGRVRHLGISNFSAQEYDEFCVRLGEVPEVNQVESHVYLPRLSLQEHLTARGTLMQGWAPFTEGRKNIFSEPVLQSIGRIHGKTAGQIALKFLVQNGIAVIPKSTHRGRMEENISLFDFLLSDEEMHTIRRLNTGKSLFGWYD